MHHSTSRPGRGLSTVLGTLLLVGILFTCIIPVFLYVNEVNNYYDRTVVDMKIADEERGMENLEVYAYGEGDSNNVSLFIINRGTLNAEVLRVWSVRADMQRAIVFNSTLKIAASAQATITGLDLTRIIANDPYVDYFNFEVVTSRGRKYPSLVNPLHKSPSGWETLGQRYQIHVVIYSDWGKSDNYVIQVKNATEGFKFETSREWTSHGDYYGIFTVPNAWSYNVTVNGMKGMKSHPVPPGSQIVVLTWNYPIAVIYFDDKK
jgi:hypothetical protein